MKSLNKDSSGDYLHRDGTQDSLDFFYERYIGFFHKDSLK